MIGKFLDEGIESATYVNKESDDSYRCILRPIKSNMISERERERVKICIKRIINERRQEFGEEGKKGILFVLLN